MIIDRSTRSSRPQPRTPVRVLLLGALVAGLAACGVEEPYQSTEQLPSDRATQSATAPVEAGRQADGTVAGTTSLLPLDERAAQAHGNDWTDVTRADYDKAIADCREMGEALQQDCIEQVELGFRAAQSDVQNPSQLQGSQLQGSQRGGSRPESEAGRVGSNADAQDARRQAASDED